jgi:hypothetical protein
VLHSAPAAANLYAYPALALADVAEPPGPCGDGSYPSDGREPSWIARRRRVDPLFVASHCASHTRARLGIGTDDPHQRIAINVFVDDHTDASPSTISIRLQTSAEDRGSGLLVAQDQSRDHSPTRPA